MKIIAVALQNYGAFVSDTGGAVAFYGQTDNNIGNVTWSSVGVPYNPILSGLPWDRFQVMKILPAATGVAVPTTSITGPIVQTPTPTKSDIQAQIVAAKNLLNTISANIELL
jgi:hypothetical protein